MFRATVNLAVGCLKDLWKVAYGVPGFLGAFAASVVLWLVDGVKLIVQGLRAVIDTAVYWRTYRVLIDATKTVTTTTTVPASPGFSRFAGNWLAHASQVTIDESGNVTIMWFFNDSTANGGSWPYPSGYVTLKLNIVGTTETSFTARVVERTEPPGFDPAPGIGPGSGPNINVGDTYTMHRASQGLTGQDGLMWCDDAHNGACGA